MSKSTQSVRSVRLSKVPRPILDRYIPDEKQIELDEFITLACKKFLCPCKIRVKKEAQPEDYSKIVKQEAASSRSRRISLAVPLLKAISTPETEKVPEETVSKTSQAIEDDSIIISAFYDTLNRLAEIVIQKINVPRILLQILSLILPHHPLLSKLIIKKCRIDAYTIHDINKFLSLTSITEICLDDSPVLAANYALLLEKQSRLTNLSLCRCQINDETCKQIASKLQYSEPAETTVSILNLSSNRITDVGAKHLAEALRTNRHLRYLNLADNQIGDEGAYHIFQVLIDFPLTYDEIMSKRRRYMEYLRAKQDIYLKYLMHYEYKSQDDLSISSKKTPRKSTKLKKDKSKFTGIGDDLYQIRAESMANELMGPFRDPFSPSFTKVFDGYSHCIGNMVLCYLNLCYNHLSFTTLKKLQKVLFYQSVNKLPSQTGLMKVLLEGNNLPRSCSETERISEMLFKNVVNFSGKYVQNKLRRGRVSVVPERIVN